MNPAARVGKDYLPVTVVDGPKGSVISTYRLNHRLVQYPHPLNIVIYWGTQQSFLSRYSLMILILAITIALLDFASFEIGEALSPSPLPTVIWGFRFLYGLVSFGFIKQLWNWGWEVSNVHISFRRFMDIQNLVWPFGNYISIISW